MKGSLKGIAEVHSLKSREECIKQANELFDFWEGLGDFPVFWSKIDFDRENLENIFVFFGEMQSLLGVSEARDLLDHLQNRLFARFTDDTIPFPREHNDAIKLLSKAQILEFKRLMDLDLLQPAFELFVTGSLTSIRKQIMTSEELRSIADANAETFARVPQIELFEFEPDSGSFFFWAEFAFIASYFGFETNTWQEILPILMYSERIFALCYGQPENNVIPDDRKFSDYIRVTNDEFHTLDPTTLNQIRTTERKNLAELELEATDCAKFAFPGEFANE